MNHQSSGGPREEVKGVHFDNVESLEYCSDESVSDSENEIKNNSKIESSLVNALFWKLKSATRCK